MANKIFHSIFLLFFHPKFYPIDNPNCCVIIVIEYEIAIHKSVSSTDFENKVSAFFIFYNTPFKYK